MGNDQFNSLTLFQNNPVDPTTLVSVLFAIVVLIAALVYASYRYKKFKQMQVFAEEMSQLGLNSDEEGALTDLVKQYAMHEPVNVLLSLKTFDELACQEISRVLGSSGSVAAKDKFIHLIYEIRRKTYFPDWNREKDEADQEAAALEAEKVISKKPRKIGLKHPVGVNS